MKNNKILPSLAISFVLVVSVNAGANLIESSAEIKSKQIAGNGSKGVKPPEGATVWDNFLEYFNSKLG